MEKIEAQKKLKQYLNKNLIPFSQNNELDYIMQYRGYENCPDKTLESVIFFFEDEMEVRVYFNQTGSELCKKSEHIPELLRLFNFISARVWLSSCDFMGNTLYQPNHLYTPRLYMTEDGYFDITLTTIIPYFTYESAALETGDYITAYCPEVLNRLSPAIFGVLLGELSAEQAINYIKKNILDE